ncbi:MAG: hypothetical protein GY821_02780 [Gammaproteobacteria bacterium]|nr:hypothetical protein [Gammaproteobacteria bacterium]
MTNIMGLNIRAMVYLDAMVDNKFIPTNAALDVDDLPCAVHRQICRIEDTFSFDVFVWGKRKPSHTAVHPLRLTRRGELLHRSFKWFLTSINEEIKQ